LIEDAGLEIPLKLNGIISYFPIQTPTDKEVQELDLIPITSDIEWNPYSVTFQELETLSQNAEDDSEPLRIKMLATQPYCCEIIDDVSRNLSTTNTNKKRLVYEHEELAKRWAIGHTAALDTVKATTQNWIRSTLHLIERRFRTKHTMLRYNRLDCKFYSDTFFSDCSSVLGNKCGQLFVSDFGYTKFAPMKRKSEAGFALQELIRDVGIPRQIHTDNAKELTLGLWKETCRDANIMMTQTEKDSPWQNRTEVEIRKLKKHTRRLMSRSKTPLALWDFCCQYTTELRNRIV
jgi:hypothetical protein